MDREALVLLEQAHEEPLHAPVEAPVEDAQVVARGVIAVVSELDAAPDAPAAPVDAEAG